MSYEEKMWENLHKGIDYPIHLPDNLAYFWNRCYEKKINPKTDVFRIYSHEEFKRVKEDSTKIYAYSNRFLLQMENYLNNPQLGFALFDNKCCLLKTYGSKQFLDWCENHNIIPRTNWSEDSIGANAISIGIETNRTTSVVGSQNFCHALINTAIYFSPIIINDDKNEHDSIIFGGIAIIVPFENRNAEYNMMVAAFANDISLHLYMSNSLYNMHYTEEVGLISIDINILNEKSHILYHNSTIFNVLNTQQENLYFKNVNVLFDPLPKNKEFWDIIKNCKDIKTKHLNLSIRGTENTYIVSTDTYSQKHLGFRGIRFFISSIKQVSKNVSKHIGNNAMMTFEDIIGNNRKFTRCIKIAKAIAKSDSNALILGESGVGKDVLAQSIHNASNRRDKPFIAVNCAAFPRDLISSELFGYDGGAFTGSKRNGNIGKFELADTGTIFLDEIGDMPLDLQAILLRVIEEKKFMRLGSSIYTNVDVRIIAATNANLSQLIEQKKFRLDLYYRLSTLHITIPPLRERSVDITLLANYFIQSVSRRIGKPNLMTLSNEASDFLRQLPWKGNVRELQNLIEGIVQLYPIDIIEPEIIKDYLNISDSFDKEELPLENIKNQNNIKAFNKPINDITVEDIEHALEYNKYNKTKTANYLGISRKTLYSWLKKNNIC